MAARNPRIAKKYAKKEREVRSLLAAAEIHLEAPKIAEKDSWLESHRQPVLAEIRQAARRLAGQGAERAQAGKAGSRAGNEGGTK